MVLALLNWHVVWVEWEHARARAARGSCVSARVCRVALAPFDEHTHGMPRVKLFCATCRTALLRYNKAGNGALVKLHPSRVTADCSVPLRKSAEKAQPEHTALGVTCPKCHTVFARVTMIGGQLYRKLIGGKVSWNNRKCEL